MLKGLYIPMNISMYAVCSTFSCLVCTYIACIAIEEQAKYNQSQPSHHTLLFVNKKHVCIFIIL